MKLEPPPWKKEKRMEKAKGICENEIGQAGVTEQD
jgi:hypothetical protein